MMEKKKSPTDWKTRFFLLHHFYDIYTVWQAMPLWALPISPKSVICIFEKYKIIID